MLKIALFSDFHYKKRMYPVKVSDLEKIFERAAANNVDLVLHAGDFCNDYAGSPEITDLYLNNPQGLAVYGVYGNHNLETVGNSMDNVTPCLGNREVNFAFEGAGHWYKDGKETGVSQMKFNDLSQGKNNWSVKDPLSAILTIEDDGTITVEGTESDWACGMIPPLQFPHVCVMPAIRSRTAKIEL